MLLDGISATLKVRLKPWAAPNYARVVGMDESSADSAIPVADLDPQALEQMALAWLSDLYSKAGRSWSAEASAATIRTFANPDETAP
jgi:hypothetical protein